MVCRLQNNIGNVDYVHHKSSPSVRACTHWNWLFGANFCSKLRLICFKTINFVKGSLGNLRAKLSDQFSLQYVQLNGEISVLKYPPLHFFTDLVISGYKCAQTHKWLQTHFRYCFFFPLASDNYYRLTLHSRDGSGLFSFFSIVLNNKIKITLTGSKGQVQTDDVRW